MIRLEKWLLVITNSFLLENEQALSCSIRVDHHIFFVGPSTPLSFLLPGSLPDRSCKQAYDGFDGLSLAYLDD